jgi:hypothetical protein
VILDLIDQAMLFIYVGDKMASLRSIGLRGSIEVASLFEDLDDSDATTKAQAETIVALMSSELGESEGGVRYLIRTLYYDLQVQFIWDLWGESAVNAEDDDASENAAGTQPATVSAIAPQTDPGAQP